MNTTAVGNASIPRVILYCDESNNFGPIGSEGCLGGPGDMGMPFPEPPEEENILISFFYRARLIGVWLKKSEIETVRRLGIFSNPTMPKQEEFMFLNMVHPEIFKKYKEAWEFRTRNHK